eukprot:7507896-Pyramimonas_sp.AAC.1
MGGLPVVRASGQAFGKVGILWESRYLYSPPPMTGPTCTVSSSSPQSAMGSWPPGRLAPPAGCSRSCEFASQCGEFSSQLGEFASQWGEFTSERGRIRKPVGQASSGEFASGRAG